MIALQQLNATEFNIIMLFPLVQEMELESEHTTFHRSSSSAASVLMLLVDFHTSVNMHVVGYGHQQSISQISIVSPPLVLRWGWNKKKGKKKNKKK